MESKQNAIEIVKTYYGSILKSQESLQTNACCTVDSMPGYCREILGMIHSEVKDKFYGCGSPIPLDIGGITILDLGSGSGRDCYILSKLVGESGSVIGVDMTDEQISVANQYLDYHTTLFGFNNPNVKFINGYIEDLQSLGIEDDSVDVVISNCVINLSPNKEKVFSEIFRVLKPGGELYFSDIFASRRLTNSIKEDPVLLGECLAGALYWEDFRRLLFGLGCRDFRITSKSKIAIQNSELELKIGNIAFDSYTIRAFKLDLEDRCEDYGQAVRYLGTIKNSEYQFVLDDHHTFEKGKIYSICKNTAKMLSETRYAKHFQIFGDTTTHFGLFECSVSVRDSKVNTDISCC